MSFTDVIYMIIIYPLELIFEVIFYLSDRIIGNPGLSIIVLSLSVNFLVLPLYIRADALQKEERDIENRLSYWVEHIKKTFKGDERFMMLQTYYRENNYRSVYVFKSILPLMLQIPFFIAAYRFLLNLSLLQGFSFGPISDLGKPDGLLKLAGYSINCLPILMTIINMVSGTIYSKGGGLREKIQIYGIALIFLFLLYRSPSGLVFYWLLNNVFSLLKNVFYKFREPGKVLSGIFALGAVILMIYALLGNRFSLRRRGIMAVIGLAILLLLTIIYLNGNKKKTCNSYTATKADTIVFFLSVLVITITIGAHIPSTMISSATVDFYSISTHESLFYIIIFCTCIALGMFVVWFGIFYMLAGKAVRLAFSKTAFALAVIFLIDYMLFGTDLGFISANLIFEEEPAYSVIQCLVNTAVAVTVFIVLFILYGKIKKLIVTVLISVILISCGFIINNCMIINRDTNEIESAIGNSNDEPTIQLSKNGKNVIVLMMDRMVGYYVPYIMNEDQSLYRSFDGFTNYPNTVTFGISTKLGAPGIFGGYEYVPSKMNERADEPLVDKHNEALKLMPVLFSENGYKTTVMDPPYANYKEVSDIRIYDEYPDIRSFIVRGRLKSDLNVQKTLAQKSRDFFCYGLFKVSPVIIQPEIYNKGNYNAIRDSWSSGQVVENEYKAYGMKDLFADAYNVLDGLCGMTEIIDSDKEENCFFMMDNTTPHETILLQLPDYTPSITVDNTSFGEKQFEKFDADGNRAEISDIPNIMHYHADMISMKKLGEWFEYLKQQGVYDNTRIIIVSDHAYNLWQDENMLIDVKDKGLFNCIWFNCALLVKDFNSTGFKTDMEFMTNADVPTIAFEDIISDPINPFTGNIVNNDDKYAEELQLAFTSEVFVQEKWNVQGNTGNRFLEAPWFTVRDNIFKKDNWKYLGTY